MLVVMKSPGPVMERSTCDSAARCMTCVMACCSTTSQRGRLVAQIHLLEDVLGMPRHLLQILQPPGIGQAVQVDELGDPGSSMT